MGNSTSSPVRTLNQLLAGLLVAAPCACVQIPIPYRVFGSVEETIRARLEQLNNEYHLSNNESYWDAGLRAIQDLYRVIQSNQCTSKNWQALANTNVHLWLANFVLLLHSHAPHTLRVRSLARATVIDDSKQQPEPEPELEPEPEPESELEQDSTTLNGEIAVDGDSSSDALSASPPLLSIEHASSASPPPDRRSVTAVAIPVVPRHSTHTPEESAMLLQMMSPPPSPPKASPLFPSIAASIFATRLTTTSTTTNTNTNTTTTSSTPTTTANTTTSTSDPELTDDDASHASIHGLREYKPVSCSTREAQGSRYRIEQVLHNAIFIVTQMIIRSSVLSKGSALCL
jgi:hypothetical protein